MANLKVFVKFSIKLELSPNTSDPSATFPTKNQKAVLFIPQDSTIANLADIAKEYGKLNLSERNSPYGAVDVKLIELGGYIQDYNERNIQSLSLLVYDQGILKIIGEKLPRFSRNLTELSISNCDYDVLSEFLETALRPLSSLQTLKLESIEFESRDDDLIFTLLNMEILTSLTHFKFSGLVEEPTTSSQPS
ncbi:hypothetical protein HK098_007486 [Nowakowskiella sp. JEL0407]|nr:hypothetical protein HK098_007486 [Nowakowskiella sp. JEL0407]